MIYKHFFKENTEEHSVEAQAYSNGYKIGPVFKAYYPKDLDGKKFYKIKRPSPFPNVVGSKPDTNDEIYISGFFADDMNVANRFKFSKESVLGRFYLKLDKSFVIDGSNQLAGKLQFAETGKAFRDAIRSGKYDSVIIKNTKDEGTIYVTLKPSQSKLADAKTFTEEGEEIPLKTRFDSSNEDFRY